MLYKRKQGYPEHSNRIYICCRHLAILLHMLQPESPSTFVQAHHCLLRALQCRDLHIVGYNHLKRMTLCIIMASDHLIRSMFPTY